MKTLLWLPTLLALLVLGACDSGALLEEPAGESELFAGKNGADKETVGYSLSFFFDESYPEYTDFEISCLGGWVRGEGTMVVEGTKITTNGGNVVINWSVNYDESDLWWDFIDGMGGDRIYPGPEHDWVLVKGNQNSHDNAWTDEWNDAILFSEGPGMHQFSMHEWYYNNVTGEKQNLNYPSVFFYEGWDGADLNITKYMDHGWCPGKSGSK